MTDSRTILLWPDTHVPDHDVKAVNALVSFIADYQPDEIVQTGDFLDMKGPARWSKGSAAEYETNLQDDADKGVKVLGMVREVYDGPLKLYMGNHDIRAEKYLNDYAPALRSLRGLSFREILELDSLEIDLLPRKPYKLAPGWVASHGDEGRLVRYAGGSAIALARAYGVSVAMGHTHRQGIVQETIGLARNKLTGFELGNLMDIRKADYLKLPGNWQSGFGLLHVHGKHVKPEMVPLAKDGSFYVGGIRYASN